MAKLFGVFLDIDIGVGHTSSEVFGGASCAICVVVEASENNRNREIVLGIVVVSILAKQITLLVGVGIFSPFQHDVLRLTSVTSEIQYACWLVTNRRHDGFDDDGTDA